MMTCMQDEIHKKEIDNLKEQLLQIEIELNNCMIERNNFVDIIEEAIKKTKVVKEYKFDLIGRYEILEILNKYRGEKNE